MSRHGLSFTITRTDGETRTFEGDEGAALVLALAFGVSDLHQRATSAVLGTDVQGDLMLRRWRDSCEVHAWLWPEDEMDRAVDRARARSKALSQAMNDAIGDE